MVITQPGHMVLLLWSNEDKKERTCRGWGLQCSPFAHSPLIETVFCRVSDIRLAPCKSLRKGQALPEWLAGRKTLHFIYGIVNTSLIAAGFLGFNSPTGHLISHSATRLGRKQHVVSNEALVQDAVMQAFQQTGN